MLCPARNARHGHIFTWDGVINLINAKYERDDRPIDEHCDCPVCRQHSRAYIRHLLKAGEMLGMRLAVMHNLYFYNTLMERIREALDNDTFDEFYQKYVPILGRRIVTAQRIGVKSGIFSVLPCKQPFFSV